MRQFYVRVDRWSFQPFTGVKFSIIEILTQSPSLNCRLDEGKVSKLKICRRLVPSMLGAGPATSRTFVRDTWVGVSAVRTCRHSGVGPGELLLRDSSRCLFAASSTRRTRGTWRDVCRGSILYVQLDRAYSFLEAFSVNAKMPKSERLWTFLNVCECLWTFVKAFERLWTFVKVFERLWTFVNVWECRWTFVNVCERL